MKHGLFKVFRIVTFAGLVVLLAVHIGHAPVLKRLLFVALAVLWFVPTLLPAGAQSRVGRALLRHDAVLTAVDAYLVMATAAVVLFGSWNYPVQLLGAYVFLAGAVCGPQAGATAAFAAFFGLLNSWLLPVGDLRAASILSGAGAALMALVVGTAWCWSLPLLARMVQQSVAGVSQPAAPAVPVAEQIAALEVRLRAVSAERDHAPEQLSEREAKLAARQTAEASPAPPVEPAAEPEPTAGAAPESPRSAIVVPATDDPALKARLEQVAAALADGRAERVALLAEKQKLLSEVADLAKELKAVQASAAEAAGTPATSPEGGSHANG